MYINNKISALSIYSWVPIAGSVLDLVLLSSEANISLLFFIHNVQNIQVPGFSFLAFAGHYFHRFELTIVDYVRCNE